MNDDLLDDLDVPSPNGEEFMGQRGVKTLKLARAVLDAGPPLAIGPGGTWWTYDGGVWTEDDGVINDRCARLLRDNYRSTHPVQVAGLLRAVPSLPRITGDDPDPSVINFRNGALDWLTGQITPHTPERLATVQIPVTWDPDARCPNFDRWLADVFPEDMIPMAWELVGYLLYQGNPFSCAFLLLGDGSNGKSTFLRVMRALLGGANVSSVTLNGINGGKFDLADLYGKLANFAGDIDATYQVNTAGLKMVTGNDTIRAERKYRDPFVFKPWATHVFSANKAPGSADVSHGYLRRWTIVPFPNQFTPGPDPTPGLTTPGELAGIAAHGVAALRGLMVRGKFAESVTLTSAAQRFAEDLDQVREWLSARTDGADQGSWTARTTLYQDYRAWAWSADHKPVGSREFYTRLRGANIPEGKRGVDGFRIALRTSTSTDSAWTGSRD